MGFFFPKVVLDFSLWDLNQHFLSVAVLLVCVCAAARREDSRVNISTFPSAGSRFSHTGSTQCDEVVNCSVRTLPSSWSSSHIRLFSSCVVTGGSVWLQGSAPCSTTTFEHSLVIYCSIYLAPRIKDRGEYWGPGAEYDQKSHKWVNFKGLFKRDRIHDPKTKTRNSSVALSREQFSVTSIFWAEFTDLHFAFGLLSTYSQKHKSVPSRPQEALYKCEKLHLRAVTTLQLLSMIVDLIYVALLRCLLIDSKSGFGFLGQSLDVHRANGIERGVNEEPGVGDLSGSRNLQYTGGLCVSAGGG